jgi:predicted permease
LIETLIQDLRYGLRMLMKNPGFTIIAVLSLGLGIGANTAIFSLVNTAILRPLPVDRPEELVSLKNANEFRVSTGFSYPNYKDFRDRNEVFSGLFGYRFAPVSVSRDEVKEKLWSYIVTGNYFDVLGVKPALGQLLSVDDDRLPGAHPVTVLSYKYWSQGLGADPAVVGKNLLVNGRSFTVIGVAPKGFFGTEIIAEPQLWFPMAMQAELELGGGWLDKRGVEQTLVQGRLKPGIRSAQAQAALTGIALQLESEYPDINQGKRAIVTPLESGLMGGMMMGVMLNFAGLLMIVVLFVLLLACINLANLLLARAIDRRKEVAVRLTVGASRRRLVQQMLTESILLALLSGVFGLLLAYWLINLVSEFKLPVDFPLLIDLHIDYRVLLFTFLTSLLVGVLFGLLPALQATKVDLLPALKNDLSLGGARRSWWKSSLIVLQVALSLVLLIGGGLMLRALQRSQTINLGFTPQNAVEVSFDLRLQNYDTARGKIIQKTLLERLRAFPDVQYAGIIDLPPVDLHFPRSSVLLEGQAPERIPPRAMTSRISPGYLQAIGTALLQGRDFTEQDDENALPVAIVNETFARRFWPGENPIGKRFMQGATDSPMVQVVGVVQDGKYAGLSEGPQPYVCRPMLQAYTGSTTVVVRSATNPANLLAIIRDEVRQIDPRMPISRAQPLTQKMSVPLLPARLAAWLLGSFGLLALALAAIGIYGVMSIAVSRRTHEIGVRMALGAQASDVLRLAIGQGVKLTLIGVAIGLGLALLLTQSLKSLLVGVSATDPLTFASVAVLLLGVALLACYLPARRATRISPTEALRNE